MLVRQLIQATWLQHHELPTSSHEISLSPFPSVACRVYLAFGLSFFFSAISHSLQSAQQQ
jgi:hypothetical protein